MDIKKRVRAELRDLLAQKKQEQEEQAILATEVGFLREEKERLSSERQIEKDTHQVIVDLLRQEATLLKQEKDNATKEVENLIKTQSNLESAILKKQQFILDLTQNIHDLVISEGEAKRQAREFLDKLDIAEEIYRKQQILNHEQDLDLRFLQKEILLAEENLFGLKNNIDQAEANLDRLIKEQFRHAQWDQYLREKENFLIEQFKLMGVKYVVYNSK